MATTHSNEVQAIQAVQQAANQLAALEWLDQEQAQQLGRVAEAAANMFMVVFYQAETGRASKADFQEALNTLRQACPA